MSSTSLLRQPHPTPISCHPLAPPRKVKQHAGGPTIPRFKWIGHMYSSPCCPPAPIHFDVPVLRAGYRTSHAAAAAITNTPINSVPKLTSQPSVLGSGGGIPQSRSMRIITLKPRTVRFAHSICSHARQYATCSCGRNCSGMAGGCWWTGILGGADVYIVWLQRAGAMLLVLPIKVSVSKGILISFDFVPLKFPARGRCRNMQLIRNGRCFGVKKDEISGLFRGLDCILFRTWVHVRYTDLNSYRVSYCLTSSSEPIISLNPLKLLLPTLSLKSLLRYTNRFHGIINFNIFREIRPGTDLQARSQLPTADVIPLFGPSHKH